MKRVLIAASGGGHLDQLSMIVPAIGDPRVLLATTHSAQARLRGYDRIETLPDCNITQPIRSLRCAIAAFGLVARARPEITVSTGAAPGLFCIFWGRVLGARTLWIDSIANAERLSLSGRIASHIAHDCLTQWEELADGDKIKFIGSVL